MALAPRMGAGVASVGLKASSGSAAGLQGAGLVCDEIKDEKPDGGGEIANAEKGSESMRDVTL
jgi:hypothetical protein